MYGGVAGEAGRPVPLCRLPASIARTIEASPELTSQKLVSGQSIDVDSSVATRAFVGTYFRPLWKAGPPRCIQRAVGSGPVKT